MAVMHVSCKTSSCNLITGLCVFYKKETSSRAHIKELWLGAKLTAVQSESCNKQGDQNNS